MEAAEQLEVVFDDFRRSLEKAATLAQLGQKKHLTTAEAVALGYFSSDLAAAQLRFKRKGPRFTKHGTGKNAHVTYAVSDLEAWKERDKVLTIDSEGCR